MSAGSFASAKLTMTCWTPASASRPKRSTIASGDSGARLQAPGAAEADALHVRPLDLGEVAPDRRAVLGQDRVLRQQLRRVRRTGSRHRRTGRRAEASSRSPPPPIMIGTRGRRDRLGDVEQPGRVELAALEVLLRASLALPHAVGDPERVLEHLEPLGGGRPREAEALRLGLVPGRADAEPRPAAGEDVEGRRGLDPQPGVAVMDAADHQPEPGPLAVGGHEAERRPALEHRLELRARRRRSARSGP